LNFEYLFNSNKKQKVLKPKKFQKQKVKKIFFFGMEDNDQKILKSLNRLAGVREGQKISTEGKSGEILIEPEGVFQWVFRTWWLGGRPESRAQNIAAVEEKFMEAYGIVERCLSREQSFQLNPSNTLERKMDRTKNLQLISSTRVTMYDALVGFTNLIPTYKNKHDQNVESDIKGVMTRVNDLLSRVDLIIQEIYNGLQPEWKQILQNIIHATPHMNKKEPEKIVHVWNLPQPIPSISNSFVANSSTAPEPSRVVVPPKIHPPTPKSMQTRESSVQASVFDNGPLEVGSEENLDNVDHTDAINTDQVHVSTPESIKNESEEIASSSVHSYNPQMFHKKKNKK